MSCVISIWVQHTALRGCVMQEFTYFHCSSQRVLWAALSPQLLHGLQQRFGALKVGAHHLVAVHPHLLKQRLLRQWEYARVFNILDLPVGPISSNSASCESESARVG